jgi:hypothetical protein
VASPRKTTTPGSPRTRTSASEYPIRVSPVRNGSHDVPHIEVDLADNAGVARTGSPEIERLLRENIAHLRQVNAELVGSSKDPARQRALLEERTQLNSTIAALQQQQQRQSQSTPPPVLQHSVSVDGHNARLADSPSRNTAPAGAVCSSCGSAKVGGRIKSNDGSSAWYCRACISQLSRCARCSKVGRHTATAHVGGVDCFLCDDCAVPPDPSSPSSVVSSKSSKPQRHTISYSSAAQATSSSSPTASPAASPAKVPPMRSLESSAPLDGQRPPATARSAPRRLTTSEPLPEQAQLPRAKSTSAVATTKLADGESIWGKGAAPWESFKATGLRRRLSERLITMLPMEKPKKGKSMQSQSTDRCVGCRMERGVIRLHRDDGTVALLCTSCRISLNFRAAIGE